MSFIEIVFLCTDAPPSFDRIGGKRGPVTSGPDNHRMVQKMERVLSNRFSIVEFGCFYPIPEYLLIKAI